MSSAGHEESQISGILDLECPQGPQLLHVPMGRLGPVMGRTQPVSGEAKPGTLPLLFQQDPFVPTHICQQGSLNGHSSLGGQFCKICEHLKYTNILPHTFHFMNSCYRNIFTSFIRYVQVCLHCFDHSEKLEATSVSFRGGLSRWMVCVCTVAQLCPTLCDPMARSPTGSSVHKILKGRIPERVAILSSRGPS